MEYQLRQVSFPELPGWQTDDPSELIDALRRCRDYVTAAKPYRTGSLGISVGDLLPAYEASVDFSPVDAIHARGFFEKHFVPFLIFPGDRPQGFVTAFYEPDVAVSAFADKEYRFPFYRRPPDLVDVDHVNRPADLDPYFAFGRDHDGVTSEYPDRGMIDRGFLDGRGLEIAYARSKIDVFFAHVQGAARLVYADGTVRRITYAAKTGHYFSAIGKLLIDRGEIDRASVSMGSIRAWLAAHPQEMDEVLWHNRSYIFFREAPVEDMALGPVAAAKVPLVAGRALAVDKAIHTFGMPFFVSSETLTHLDHGQPFGRLMLSLDTGSAIVGPARGDIFTGSGDDAGDLAGSVRNDADIFILIPATAAARYRHG